MLSGPRDARATERDLAYAQYHLCHRSVRVRHDRQRRDVRRSLTLAHANAMRTLREPRRRREPREEDRTARQSGADRVSSSRAPSTARGVALSADCEFRTESAGRGGTLVEGLGHQGGPFPPFGAGRVFAAAAFVAPASCGVGRRLGQRSRRGGVSED